MTPDPAFTRWLAEKRAEARGLSVRMNADAISQQLFGHPLAKPNYHALGFDGPPEDRN